MQKISDPTKPALNPWFLRPRVITDPVLRLFCFPYAGGSAAVYHKWPTALPADIELVAVQYPGRGTRMRETPLCQLAPLLDGLEQAILPLLDRPFAFFGHSMGATIAFELARRLRTAQQPLPTQLFLSGRSAPHLPPIEPPIHSLTEAQFFKRMRTLNGTPVEILEHPELMELMMPMLRADFQAIETWEYQASPPLDIPLSVFGGLSDDGVPIDRLDAWAEHTTHKLKRHLFPGDHFYLNAQYPALLNIISRAVNKT